MCRCTDLASSRTEPPTAFHPCFPCNYGSSRCSLAPCKVCTRHLGAPCIAHPYQADIIDDYVENEGIVWPPIRIAVGDSDCGVVGILGKAWMFVNVYVPSRHSGNYRQAASPLVRLVDGEEKKEDSDLPPRVVLPQNWDGTKPNHAHGEEVFLTIAIPDYRPSIEDVELSSPVQHNASLDKNSRTTAMVSFLDVTGIKPCPYLSPNQNALRIASGTEPTLIRKEDTTPVVSCPVFVLSAPL
ncbi:uncharacterized protein TNCV_1002291 [Trichonephila clavipes]|nr:uncharacterized protein TNCV_1002291 [Trichonephila clavipes]